MAFWCSDPSQPWRTSRRPQQLPRVCSNQPSSRRSARSSHREGIRIARAERLRRIVALATISTSLREAADTSTLTKVLHPISMPKVVSRANAINGEVARFALQTGLGDLPDGEVAATPWSASVQTLLGDAAGAVSATSLDAAGKVGDFVTSAGFNVLESAKSWGRQVEGLRGRAINKKADDADEGIAGSTTRRRSRAHVAWADWPSGSRDASSRMNPSRCASLG